MHHDFWHERHWPRLGVLAENPKFAEFGIPALHETAFVMRRVGPRDDYPLVSMAPLTRT